MFRILLLLILLIPAVSFSQVFIDQPKTLVLKELEEYKKDKKYSEPVSITETDSIIVLSTGKPATRFTFAFDKQGLCKSTKIFASGQPGYKKYLDEILAEKKYNWKQLNENQYVSDFDHQLMIELPTENDKYYFTVFRIAWTKEIYKLLTEQ